MTREREREREKRERERERERRSAPAKCRCDVALMVGTEASAFEVDIYWFHMVSHKVCFHMCFLIYIA